MNSVFSIQGLSCRAGEHIIFEDTDIDIPAGSISAVFGDSGTGKTTFLKILSLLFREEPDYIVSGKVLYRSGSTENDILKMRNEFWKIRRKIVYLSQAPNPFHMSIRKNLEFPLKLQGGFSKQEIEDKTLKVLKDVNLYGEVRDRLHVQADGLSGGQKQKLCIARALTLEPEVLLMDEPTSSLDTSNKKIIEDLIIELGNKYTIIMVSHDREQIKRVARNYFECRDKKIIQK